MCYVLSLAWPLELFHLFWVRMSIVAHSQLPPQSSHREGLGGHETIRGALMVDTKPPQSSHREGLGSYAPPSTLIPLL